MQILLKDTYVGRIADAWSAGVALYAMLNGSFPFARVEDNCENEVLSDHSAVCITRKLPHCFTPISITKANCGHVEHGELLSCVCRMTDACAPV